MKAIKHVNYESFTQAKGSRLFSKLAGINGALPLAYAERLMHIDNGLELLEHAISGLHPNQPAIEQRFLYDPFVCQKYQLIKIEGKYNKLGQMILGKSIVGDQVYGKINQNVDN